MRYHAVCSESAYEVTDSTLTNHHLNIDWKEGSKLGHLKADSTDGVTYEGHYGYPELDTFRTVTFQRQPAHHGVIVLQGVWKNHNEGSHGAWNFSLTPKPHGDA
jgi:hypothetical protein